MTPKEEYFVRIMNQRMDNDGCYPKAICFCIVIAVILILSSCSVLTKTEYRDRDVNHYITNTVHDTLRIKETDSTHVETVTRNDTVFQTVYREKTGWRDRIVVKHDTCWRDSTTVIRKETTKEITKIPKLFKISFVFSILVIIFAFVKLIRWTRVL